MDKTELYIKLKMRLQLKIANIHRNRRGNRSKKQIKDPN